MLNTCLTSHSTHSQGIRSQAVWLLGKEGCEWPGLKSKGRRRRWRPQKENIPGEGEAHVWKTGEEFGLVGTEVCTRWWEIDGKGRPLTVLGGHRLDGKSTREPKKSFYRGQDQPRFLEGEGSLLCQQNSPFPAGLVLKGTPSRPGIPGQARTVQVVIRPIPWLQNVPLLPQIPQPWGPRSPA